ncbi:hypothetical protein EYF80_051059 [Liparis tanakae]|uniref:Uncharacterized protein n=1 Tax=Liparis tanakae TaxID=230148 RepID=A0A4Z2FC59_9TELE|nr:hypothetical protein EYF80_051059 [Liparis tanakae]
MALKLSRGQKQPGGRLIVKGPLEDNDARLPGGFRRRCLEKKIAHSQARCSQLPPACISGSYDRALCWRPVSTCYELHTRLMQK